MVTGLAAQPLVIIINGRVCVCVCYKMCNMQTGSKADLGCVPVRVLATEFLLNFSMRRRRSNDQLLHSITYPPRLICQPPELALMPAPHQQAADVRLARHDHAHRRLQSGVELVRVVVAQKNLQCTHTPARLTALCPGLPR